MKKIRNPLVLIARVILGLGFTVFGLNILFPFLPMPSTQPPAMVLQFMGVMMPSHWMSVVGFFELAGGLMVLLGGTAPLGLAFLAPVLVNILTFHILLMGGEGIVAGLVFSILEVFLIYSYRNHFAGLFTTKALPNLASPSQYRSANNEQRPGI